MGEYGGPSGQLSLPVRLDDSATLENFFLPSDSPNSHLISTLQDIENLPSLYLWGDNGAGVTHLLQALCHQAQKYQQSAIYIPLHEFQEQPAEQMLAGMESMNLICLDELESVSADSLWAEQLFHLFNRSLTSNCKLVFGAQASPAALDTPLADLRSRLSSVLLYKVTKLSDQEITQALVFRARRRGMEMPSSVAQYLVTRYSRDLSDQFRALDKLDQATLVEKRKLTIPFVKSILEDKRDE